MSRVLTAVLCFAFFAPSGLAGEQKTKDDKAKGPPADKLLADGLAKAKKESKAVFLAFGSPT
ncbi:MAG: hypothetical protein L0Y72_10200 [Gemmataceae bacterium]|nr:hypothetical protein [Gemmataceae bacterium]MCI0739404.1 hypothetical protein [Gemmataceae bacterium]